MRKRVKNYIINLIIPAFVFGSITGILTSVVITLYKVCAKYIIQISENGYSYLRTHLYFVPIVLIVLFGIAFLLSFIYKRNANLKGGGIPTSIGILRGVITFKWLRNLIGTFFISLVTFLIGVPLGNEGPSVQMGTAIGKGSVANTKKHGAWSRYTMTGGACAGFSVATGAPISGILFAIEEAHGRISPMIIIVSATAVMFASITSELLAPIFNVSTSLFPQISLKVLDVKDVWIPLVIGIAMGLFAVLFLRSYRFLNNLLNKKFKRIPHFIKIFSVFLLTLIVGLFSFSFVSTGHELINILLDGDIVIYMLILIILVRSILTIFANSNSITGGIFLPILAIGATVSALLAKGVLALGLDSEYYTVILMLGICACISSVMKMPLTAIVFAIEALSGYTNILYVIVVAATAYIITEIFNAQSINEKVLDNRVKEFNEGKTSIVIDTFVTVQKNSFAIGKQIRDIFWPSNLFVLSLKHTENIDAEVDGYGEKAIHEGDILHVRYSTFDASETKKELLAIVGEQQYSESEDKTV